MLGGLLLLMSQAGSSVLTFIPVAFAVDVAFFPFQIVSGCYPYHDSYMRPEDGGDV